MNYLLIISCIVVFFLSSGSATADYPPWSEKVFISVEEEYGVDAVKRVRNLHTIILENQDLPAMEKLDLVNKTLNYLPWIADSQHWKKSDYWASPMETLSTFGGDCEDIAIVKWMMLRHLGIPYEHLRLAYVKVKATGEIHMVLLYLTYPSKPPKQWEAYVLDNLDPEIKIGVERTDLMAVYLTDGDGTIVLIEDTGDGRNVKGIYKDRKTRSLDDLIKKMEADREKYKKLNDGRDLLPKF